MAKDRAIYHGAMLKKKIAMIEVEKVSKQVRLDVNIALTNIIMLQKRNETAIRNRQMAEKKLSAEKKRLWDLGLSSIFNVLAYQQDYTQAALNAVDAETDYHVSLIELDKIVGRLLEKNNVMLTYSHDKGELSAK